MNTNLSPLPHRSGRCIRPRFPAERSGWFAVAWLAVLMIMSLSFHAAYLRWLSPLNRHVSTQESASPAVSDSASVALAIPDSGDERGYYFIAINLLSGRGYSLSSPDEPAEPTAFRPPLFPALLAFVFWIFGASYGIGLWVNKALVVLLIPVSFWIGKSLFNSRCGLIAATMVALWPHGFFFGSFLLTEPLFTILQVVTFGLLLRSIATPSPIRVAMAGLAAAATFLTRPGFAVVIVFVGLWFFVLSRKHKPWRLVGVFWGVVAVVASPWVIRNYLAMDTLILGTTGSGAVFAGAHNSETLDCCPGSWGEPPLPDEQYAEMSETERDAYFWEMGTNFLTNASPQDLGKLFVFKVLRLWLPLQRIVADHVCLPCNVLSSLLFLILVVASGLGLWSHRSKESLLLVAAFAGGTTLVSIIFWGTTRFRMPLEPILWVFAAYKVTQLIEAYRPSWLRGMSDGRASRQNESTD